MRRVLWYQARVPNHLGATLVRASRTPFFVLTCLTLSELRDTLTPTMRRADVRRVAVECWQSIGPHNAVLLRTGELYADRRVTWYRER